MEQFAGISSRSFGTFSNDGQFSLAIGASFGLERLLRSEVDFGHTMSCSCAGCAAVAAEGFEKIQANDEGSHESSANGVDIPGDLSTGATIAVGGSVTDELEVVGDTDWFRIDLAAGDSIAISLFGSGASPVSDTYLRIYDSSGNLVAENDDGGEGLNSFLRFISENGGTYYIEADSYANNKLGEYTLQVAEVEPLELYSNDQIAYQLTNGYWGGTARSWNVGNDGQLTYDVSALPDDARFLAQQALLLWGDATGIQFVSVTGNAEITFQDSANGAYASSSWSGGTIISSTINISAEWLANYGTGLNSYSFQTYIHEIGHALGLGHGGNYNGNADYATDASYLNDSWATTVMSYFSQTENGYFAERGFSRAYITTPMGADLVAIGNLYGLSSTTRLGDTTYGFNNNSGRAIFNASVHSSNAYTIIDSGGRDTLDYSGYADDQLIDLRPENFSNIGGLTGNVSIARGTVIENARGGSGSDSIYGNQVANVVHGNDGDDRIVGNAGNDRLYGGAGADRISGDGGYDIIRGGQGNDDISGGWGKDTLFGDAGDDHIDGGELDDLIYGGAGADILYGGNGNDTIDGQSDDDTIFGGNGFDQINGGLGADTIRGGWGNDTIYGDNGNDTIFGEASNDTIFGGFGRDTISGGAGSDYIDGGDDVDVLNGGDYADTIRGGFGSDRIDGDSGNDVLHGDAGYDTLEGGNGWDTMFGGSGNDTLDGGWGNDFLAGNTGADVLTGGAGNDVFFFDAFGVANADSITDFEAGKDTIRLDANVFTELGQHGALASSAFRSGTSALDADDRIIYDSSTGQIWYDADGNGAGAKVLFATVEAQTALSASDFAVSGSQAAQSSLASLGDLSSTDNVIFV